MSITAALYYTIRSFRCIISILRTLLKNDSSVLIFDEPTSALDYKSKINLLNYLKEIKEDKIIILISHDDEIKEIVDEVILL